jgi:thiamine-monophosphate kinase
MPATEFDIIDHYFRQPARRDDVVLSVGDDGAVVAVPPGKQLVVTTDTLVAGVHFPENTSAQDIARKSVAVNLSDLAAMGAQPAWLTLALTLPRVDESWLEKFARDFIDTAAQYGAELIGGDISEGPLNISVTAMGLVDADAVMRRDRAQAGDAIYVTGTLGDAAIGLALLQQDSINDDSSAWLAGRLNRPEPRVDFALLAARCCDCAIDISDGLAADLGHVLDASGCGADVRLDSIPLSPQALAHFNAAGGIDWDVILSGGDDYELCVVTAPANEAQLVQAARQSGTRLSRVGEIMRRPGLRFLDAGGETRALANRGFEHFSS